MFLKHIHILTAPLGKTRLSCTLGMSQWILPAWLPLLPGLLRLFDPGLNSEQQWSRNQWDGWILIPKEVRRQEPDHLLKKEKWDILSSPSASSVMHTICFSHQHWRAFWTWISWFSSPPFLFYPKRFALHRRKTSCPTCRSLHRSFSACQPLQVEVWLHGSSAALHRQPPQSRVFSARLRQRGLWNPPCV